VGDGGGKEYGVTTSAAKVHRCSDVTVTTSAYSAAVALTSHPSLVGSFSGVHLNQTHTRAVTCGKSQSGSTRCRLILFEHYIHL